MFETEIMLRNGLGIIILVRALIKQSWSIGDGA